MQLVSYFVSGVLFAVGLVLGGMTQPQKIIGFLDVFGHWDPSLAFVMLAAVGVHSVTYRLTMRRTKPLMAPGFLVPKRSDIDASLVVGAALFGIGWGLGGYCPGPALVGSGALVPDAATFVGSTVVGHWVYGKYIRWAQRRAILDNQRQTGTTPAQAV
jgi:uncharacterized protein